MVTRSRKNWRPTDWVQLIAALALAVWVNRAPLWDIGFISLNDPEQSHILLVPVVAAYLFWLRRSRLRCVLVRPSLLGPLVVAAGAVVSWWGFHSGLQLAWHAGAIVCLIGVALSMTGLLPLRLFAPVFASLVFLLPVPGQIRHALALPLQDLAASVTHSTLELLGIGCLKSGNLLIINGEQVAVGEACNGMRMMFALTLVVYAFTFGTPLRTGVRLVLLAASPAIALGCNVLRLIPTSLIFGFGNLDTAQQFHDVAGWAMLPMALFILAAMIRMVRWLEFPVSPLRLAAQ